MNSEQIKAKVAEWRKACNGLTVDGVDGTKLDKLNADRKTRAAAFPALLTVMEDLIFYARPDRVLQGDVLRDILSDAFTEKP